MKHFLLLLWLICIAAAANAAPQAARKPNILIILADDMGYSDIRCYGGEVETPNLDNLARNGLRFTQFYNTARCWPSRAALLTGYYAQQVRRDALPGVSPSGVRGVRPEWARMLPDLLKSQGYRSYHSGKWHLDGLPLENGFDHSYYVEDTDRYFGPQKHFEDDKPLPIPAKDSGYYATTVMADHAIKYLKEHHERYRDKPFFQYLAFTSPHFPLQALPQDIAKYRERFAGGWDCLRQERLQRMTALGIVNTELSARASEVPAWDSLGAVEKKEWQQRMAVHAAMIDRMDREIGRVLAQLKSTGDIDNTVVFFLSDNGASAEKLVRGDGNDSAASPGSAASFLCLEPGWANLANAPLRYTKMFVHEGGISTPLIVHWPKGIRAQGELRHTPGHLIDIAPTILSLVGMPVPEKANGTARPPIPGRSLVPSLTRNEPISRDDLWWFHEGNRAIRVGDWKLVSAGADAPWELYNLRTDRSERHDLASKYPATVRNLAQKWGKQLEEFQALAQPKP
ncbi:MAG: arylsulfatase [Armatimonadota bacterium]